MWIRSWWTKRRGWQKFLLVLLAALVIYEIPKIKYHPWRNFHPQYTVTIKGHVDPKIAGIVKLKWIAVYGSSIPECDITYNWFEGIAGARAKTIEFVPQITPSGDYEIQIPIDYFKPGYCKWQIYEINDETDTYTFRLEEQASTFTQFYPCGQSVGCIAAQINPKTPAEASYITKGNRDNIYQFNRKKLLILEDIKNWQPFNSRWIVPRNDKYIFIENYILKP